jgi:DoxX-like family
MLMRYVVWSVQGLLALVFVFAGAMKLITPVEVLAEQTPLPGLLIQFVGVAELLGGLGLVLPCLLRIRPGLTVLAAVELAHVMLGAVVITLAIGGGALALMPAIVGLLLGFVAYARSHQLTARPVLDARRHGVYSAV